MIYRRRNSANNDRHRIINALSGRDLKFSKYPGVDWVTRRQNYFAFENLTQIVPDKKSNIKIIGRFSVLSNTVHGYKYKKKKKISFDCYEKTKPAQLR